jgi:hypothetical protein
MVGGQVFAAAIRVDAPEQQGITLQQQQQPGQLR